MIRSKTPSVSFIIPTLNASRILERCLIAIRSQDYPQDKVEIIVSDGGSEDKTLSLAKKYSARIISNKEVIHEPGKTLGSTIAHGKILFYTDADNILAHKNWLKMMIKPYIDDPSIKGFLPQTEPPIDSSSLNRYLGYLFTDPFTWFVYGNSANPKDYNKVYKPLKENDHYKIYKFPKNNLPLFGLSQGVGTSSNFKRDGIGKNDDLLAGIKLIREGGLIAYVPEARIYHYHVEGINDFLRKYKWRIRNNFVQKVKGMGFSNREIYLDRVKVLRKYLFVIYGLSLIFPAIDSIRFFIRYKDPVLFLHMPICFLLSFLIFKETFLFTIGKTKLPGTYG